MMPEEPLEPKYTGRLASIDSTDVTEDPRSRLVMMLEEPLEPTYTGRLASTDSTDVTEAGFDIAGVA